MLFNVAGWVYELKISEGPLHDEAGQPIAGICSESKRQIVISGDAPPRQRLDVLLHELRHAWQYHVGRPSDDEGDANTAATFTASFMRQFLRQGGEPALMSLGLDGVIDRGIGGAPQAPTGCQCGTCGTSYGAQQIVSEAPTVDARSGLPGVTRRIYCEHCDHVMEWIEATNQSGVPVGQVVAGPSYIRGQASRDFLLEHGHKFGVYV